MEWSGDTGAPRTTYRLVRPSLTGEPPVLDEQQQRVVDHDGGPAAGAGRARHRQDHDAGRGDRAPHRRGHPPRPDPGADLLAQGRRAAARPGHRAGRPHHVGEHRLDVPLLRLRPDPALRAGRALRRPAAAAVGARAGRRAARAAAGPPRVDQVARRAPARARHPWVRARGPRRAVPRPGEGARRRGAPAAG